MDYSKYKFNYFDVVKRHERIINRPKDWEIKLVAFFLLFAVVINCFSLVGYCSDEESVSISSVNNLTIANNKNYFSSSDTYNVYYFELEKGYVYNITNNKSTANLPLATSSNIPSLNVTYDYLGIIRPGESYQYISNYGNNYLYFSIQGVNDANIVITKTKISGQSGAIESLVQNVGIDNLWGVFESGVSFIGVVVLVAFGLFLVVLAIKKVSRGKSDF